MATIKTAFRCCVACILPCGALDVIRIVHANGRVEEISGTVKADEIMKLHPKHVLKRTASPSSLSEDGGACTKIASVPPDALLKRGKIYFLIPLPPEQGKARRRSASMKRKKRDLATDRYLSEILSEKISMPPRDRRHSRVGMWRPHLESIAEAPGDE